MCCSRQQTRFARGKTPKSASRQSHDDFRAGTSRLATRLPRILASVGDVLVCLERQLKCWKSEVCIHPLRHDLSMVFKSMPKYIMRPRSVPKTKIRLTNSSPPQAHTPTAPHTPLQPLPTPSHSPPTTPPPTPHPHTPPHSNTMSTYNPAEPTTGAPLARRSAVREKWPRRAVRTRLWMERCRRRRRRGCRVFGSLWGGRGLCCYGYPLIIINSAVVEHADCWRREDEYVPVFTNPGSTATTTIGTLAFCTLLRNSNANSALAVLDMPYRPRTGDMSSVCLSLKSSLVRKCRRPGLRVLTTLEESYESR